MQSKIFCVYIMSNFSRTLYVGVTSDLERRVYEHKKKLFAGFTSQYNVTNPVYWETLPDAISAIRREKELKGWVRERKVKLIEYRNPTWEDLAARWYAPGRPGTHPKSSPT
ncbi:MAG: GIY-YIG nuclease family protein [Gemmatimonadetes bacterium]|nr:GIY-YIG nuclease family protein [Gemmatimonadota bacterium]